LRTKLPLIHFDAQQAIDRLAGEHKLNLLFKTTRWSETANGCLVLDRTGTTAERHERELKNPKEH